MPKFKVRARWYRDDGTVLGVADDTVEGEDACDVFDDAMPGSWKDGEYTSCTVTIEKL
jgi:hypothetical protein